MASYLSRLPFRAACERPWALLHLIVTFIISAVVTPRSVACLAAAWALGGCSGPADSGPSPEPISNLGGDPVDVPLDGVTRQQVLEFQKGDDRFDIPFRESDGLGPLYIRI